MHCFCGSPMHSLRTQCTGTDKNVQMAHACTGALQQSRQISAARSALPVPMCLNRRSILMCGHPGSTTEILNGTWYCCQVVVADVKRHCALRSIRAHSSNVSWQRGQIWQTQVPHGHDAALPPGLCAHAGRSWLRTWITGVHRRRRKLASIFARLRTRLALRGGRPRIALCLQVLCSWRREHGTRGSQ